MENKMEPLYFWIQYFKEHINTIGCVELDGLDCREVLALLQELADKKVDKPNKMEAVAALFSKKLDEEFHFKVGKTVMKAKWTEMGLMSTDFTGRWWPCCYMPSLLTGQAVIINED